MYIYTVLVDFLLLQLTQICLNQSIQKYWHWPFPYPQCINRFIELRYQEMSSPNTWLVNTSINDLLRWNNLKIQAWNIWLRQMWHVFFVQALTENLRPQVSARWFQLVVEDTVLRLGVLVVAYLKKFATTELWGGLGCLSSLKCRCRRWKLLMQVGKKTKQSM